MSKHDIDVRDPVEFEIEGEGPEGKPLHEYAGMVMAKIELLWANRRWILGRTMLVMALTLGIAFLFPNRYTASVFLNPPSSNPVSGIDMLIGMKTGTINLAGQMGDVLGLQTPGQLYIRQLQTRTVEDRIIDRFGLKKVYGAKLYYTTRAVLEANTEMEEDRKSGVIRISYTDKDPGRAAQIANAYADELGRLISEVNATAGRREREYFEIQLNEARKKLDLAQRQLSEFGSKYGTMDVTEEGKALVAGAADIEGQLIASQAELKSLQQIYTEKHERVQQVRAKIAELTRQLEQLKGSAAGTPANGAPGPDGNLYPSVKNMWGMSVPYMDYYRQVKVQEAIVETLTQQYQLAKLQEAYKVSDVQVIDPAEVPERKSSPHRATMTAAAGMLVFLFCCGYLLAADWWSRTEQEDPWKRILSPLVVKVSLWRRRSRNRLHWVKWPRRMPEPASPDLQS